MWESKALERVACIHALCHSEAVAIQRRLPNSPIAVIPNGVLIPPSHLTHRNQLPWLHDIDKDANIFDVDVPTELDKTTVDTTDDKFYIHGTGTPGTENPLDVDVPTFLDRTTIDTTDGKFYVHGDNNDKDANIFDVDVPTELDKLTVDTTDDDMLITICKNLSFKASLSP